MPTQQQIAEHLDLDQSAVSRFVDKVQLDYRVATIDEIRFAYIRQPLVGRVRCRCDSAAYRPVRGERSAFHHACRAALRCNGEGEGRQADRAAARRRAQRERQTAPVTTLTPDALIDYDINFPDRASFAAVRTKVHDRKSGKKIDLTIPNPDAPPGASAVHTERHPFSSQGAAKAGATSRLATLNRHTSSSRLTMRGRADLSAEKTIALQGFKAGVDGAFLIESVEHTYASRGWLTVVTLNGGNKGKAKVGHRKKPVKKINLVVPAPK